jgi:predicted negative regulator of RcsB-dependent stress response
MLKRRLVVGVLGGVLATMCAAPGASAQTGRVSGVVHEEGGQPLKGATITADSPAFGQTFTATTDDKGRFQMIGLRNGEWRFIAQAPGHSPEGGMLNVRTGAPNPPITFELKHSGVAYFGALGGVMSKDLQGELAAADALYNQKKWDEAIAAYRAVLSRVPVLSEINLQIGAAYRNKKEYDAAMTAYGELLRVEPSNAHAKLEIANTWLERGNPQKAEEALTGAAADANAPREVFYQLGEVKLAGNDADAARSWFEKASSADPNWAKPLVRLGEISLKKGDSAAAARLLAQAVEVDPTAPEAATARAALESLKK